MSMVSDIYTSFVYIRVTMIYNTKVMDFIARDTALQSVDVY